MAVSLKYILVDIWRNRRRSVTTFIGVVLAVGFLISALVSVDSLNSLIAEDRVDDIPWDFESTTDPLLVADDGTGLVWSIEAIRAKAAELATKHGDIDQAEPMIEVGNLAIFILDPNGTYSGQDFIQVLGVEPTFADRADQHGVEADFDLASNEILIPKGFAAVHKVSINDTVYLGTHSGDTGLRAFTVKGTLSTDPFSNIADFLFNYYVSLETAYELATLPSEIEFRPPMDFDRLIEPDFDDRYLAPKGATGLTFLVWIDRDAVLDFRDEESSRENLASMKTALESGFATTPAEVTDHLGLAAGISVATLSGQAPGVAVSEALLTTGSGTAARDLTLAVSLNITGVTAPTTLEIALPIPPDLVVSGVTLGGDGIAEISWQGLEAGVGTWLLNLTGNGTLTLELSDGAGADVDFRRSAVLNAYSGLTEILFIGKLVFLILSIPAFILSFYVTYTGVELTFAERRREVAIFKVRGESRTHLFGIIIGQQVLLGLLGSIVGMVLGFLAAGLFLHFDVIFFRSTTFGQAFDGLQWYQPILALILGLGIILFASLMPTLQSVRLSIRDGLSGYSVGFSEMRSRYATWWFDSAMLMLAAGTILLFLVWEYTRELGGFANIFTCLALPFLILGLAFSPVLTIFALSRMVARGFPELYTGAAVMWRFMTREVGSYVERNVVRNPHLTGSLTVILAMTIAFGLMMTFQVATEEAFYDDVSLIAVGSEYRLTVTQDTNAIRQDVIELSGGPFVLVEELRFQTDLSLDFQVILIDAPAYQDLVDPGKVYFSHSTKPSILGDLTTPRAGAVPVLISASMTEGSNPLEKGLRPTLAYTPTDGTEVRIPVEVIGVVDALPGLQGDFRVGNTVYVDRATLLAATGGFPLPPADAPTYLFEIPGDADEAAITDSGLLNEPEVINLVSRDDVRQSVEQFSLTSNLPGVLRAQFYTMLVAVLIGVLVIVDFGARTRAREFASLLARGASRGQLMRILAGELAAVVTVSTLVGAVAGSFAIFSVMIFNRAQDLFYDAIGIPITRGFHLSWLTLIFYLLVLAVVALAAVVNLLWVRSIAVEREIRMRGG